MAWGGAALWVVVVLAGSGVAWVAIDQAGQQVTVVGPSIVPSVRAQTIAPVPRTSHTPKPTRQATLTPTPAPASSSPARPTVRPTARPAPTKASTPASRTRVRSWNGAAGTVTVSCTGTDLRLIGATPADGWRVERETTRSEITVKFEQESREVHVQAHCSQGTPVFRVESDN